MTRIEFGWLMGILFVVQGCSSNQGTPPPDNVVPVEFAKGADVGWLTEMEAAGVKFFDATGTEKEGMQLLQSKGVNSIRQRAWVNPKKGWNNTRDVVVKSLRVKKLGMRLMIDFHYSDDWADPGKQFIPAQWTSLSYADMKSALYNYTKKVMDTLKTVGITPEWVQVGNETNDGMLWEVGRASKSMANFAGFVKAGYDAVKEVSPTSQVIVHLSNGYDNGLFRWMFDGLKNNGAKWDIIGLSLYPTWAPGGVNDWATTNARCLANMNDLVARYS
ncbi:MAG: arabinogalactan endo-beta-1,4-galactanase, partial [Flammeovirgaceae bacterium]